MYYIHDRKRDSKKGIQRYILKNQGLSFVQDLPSLSFSPSSSLMKTRIKTHKHLLHPSSPPVHSDKYEQGIQPASTTVRIKASSKHFPPFTRKPSHKVFLPTLSYTNTRLLSIQVCIHAKSNHPLPPVLPKKTPIETTLLPPRLSLERGFFLQAGPSARSMNNVVPTPEYLPFKKK